LLTLVTHYQLLVILPAIELLTLTTLASRLLTRQENGRAGARPYRDFLP
jgi:hypothetical protein